jgi:hypothetical protein
VTASLFHDLIGVTIRLVAGFVGFGVLANYVDDLGGEISLDMLELLDEQVKLAVEHEDMDGGIGRSMCE